MDIGVQIQNRGGLAIDPGLMTMAKAAEDGGARSLWVGDHILFIEDDPSRYPYSVDGKLKYDSDIPWYESLISLMAMAAVTTTIRVGTAVLVLPQRHPIELAKQAATLDRLSGGRLDLGVGPGWSAGEMETLGWSFETRGPRTDEMIEILRRSFKTGMPGPYSGEHYGVGGAVRLFPLPERPIPILIGGVNPTAIRRAARVGDGWMGITFADRYSRDDIEQQLALLNPLVGERPFRRVVKVHGAPEYASAFPRIVAELNSLGVDEAIVEVPWASDIGEALACLEACKAEV
jgi:probable F420-dependent oxidoreductase